MLLDVLLLLPLFGALISFFSRRVWWCEASTLAASVLTLVLSSLVAHAVTSHGHIAGAGGWLYVDALSALTILVVGFVGATAALYSIGYLRADIRPEPDGSEEQTRSRFRRYYVLFNLFLFSMLVVPASNSLGILWIAIASPLDGFADTLAVTHRPLKCLHSAERPADDERCTFYSDLGEGTRLCVDHIRNGHDREAHRVRFAVRCK